MNFRSPLNHYHNQAIDCQNNSQNSAGSFKTETTVTQLLQIGRIAAVYFFLTPFASAEAAHYTSNGNFVFDIREPSDMTLVARLSGLTVKRDIKPSVGIIECARWAHQFGIRPFSAVTSAISPNHKRRVWICTGNANNKHLSRSYCQQMRMKYFRNDGPIVTCKLGDDI